MYSGFSEYQSISSALYVTGSEDIAYPEWANSIYSSVKDNKVLEDTYWIKGAQSTLGDGEVILPVNLMYDLMMSRYEAEIKAHPEKAEEYEGIRILFDQLMMNGKDFDEETMQIIPFTDEERRAVLNELAAAINASGIGLDYGFVLFSAYGGAPIYTELPTLRVVGFYDGETKGSYPAVVFSENTYKSVLDIHISKSEYYTVSTSVYTVPEDAVYDVIFMPYNGTRSFTDMCWELYSNKEFGADGTRISVSSSFINTLEIANEVAKLLSTVFMWVGIILALFAALLFSNFISTSISYKKREIGILRAVGARGLDVFKIFFSESAVISAVCVLLSTVGSILACNFINSKLSSGLGISLFVFGIPSFAVMLGIACITAVLATFLPVFNAARKKPVESIQAI